MPSPARFLQAPAHFPATAEPPITLSMDSDVVVILASLLCALICVVGLAFVGRCAWIRSSAAVAAAAAGSPPSSPPTNKGIKKKELRAIPKLSFAAAGSGGGGKLEECAICLAEFEEGDEIRVLPQCGHGFHAGCVDTWLASHSSCPSCRRILVVPLASTCQNCGASSGDPPAVIDHRFLP